MSERWPEFDDTTSGIDMNLDANECGLMLPKAKVRVK